MSKTTKLLAAQEAEIGDLRKALEQTYSNYTLLQRSVEDLSYIGLLGTPSWEEQTETLPNLRSTATLKRLRRLRHDNPIAKQAVKLALRFTFGRGVTYQVKDPASKDIVDAFWNDPSNQLVFSSKRAMTHRFDELLTAGEDYLAFFTSDAPPYVRVGVIPDPLQIKRVIPDPDNAEVPVWYMRVWQDRKWDTEKQTWDMRSEQRVSYYRDYRITDEMLADIESRGLVIPESRQALDRDGNPVFLKHRYINEVVIDGELHGVSELYASREWIRVFKNFMEDRGEINAMANALAMQRKIKGGPTALAKVSGSIGGIPTGFDENETLGPSDILRRARPSTGSVIDTTDNIDLKSIRADTGALHAREDAKLLLMSAGSGMNTSVSYFGESSGSLAAAQVMELPMVKGYEDWQAFHRDDFTETVEFVLAQALGVRSTPEQKVMAWYFPPIITQDVVKWTSALAQFAQQIAPGNRVVKQAAIEAALAVLDIPNRDILIDSIVADEKRLQDEKAQADQAKLTAQIAGAQALSSGAQGGGAAADGNGPTAAGGQGGGNGQKAGGGPQPSALNPDMQRLADGKAPKEARTGPVTRR